MTIYGVIGMVLIKIIKSNFWLSIILYLLKGHIGTEALKVFAFKIKSFLIQTLLDDEIIFF